jgi:hypothetical protein
MLVASATIKATPPITIQDLIIFLPWARLTGSIQQILFLILAIAPFPVILGWADSRNPALVEK